MDHIILAPKRNNKHRNNYEHNFDRDDLVRFSLRLMPMTGLNLMEGCESTEMGVVFGPLWDRAVISELSLHYWLHTLL